MNTMNLSHMPSAVLSERYNCLNNEQAAALAIGASPDTLASIRNERHRIHNEHERRGPRTLLLTAMLIANTQE